MITALPRVAIVVEDFDATVEAFRRDFGMPVEDFSAQTVPDLGAHVGMCVPEGGSNIELMAPGEASAGQPLADALRKTLERRGQGLYALMLEAPDPNAEAAELAERGLDVLGLMAGAGGRDVHPRSTAGVLIRVYPDGSVAPSEDRSSRGVGSSQATLSGIVRTVVATTDVHAAAKAYGHGFGLSTDDAVTDADRGVESIIVRPPVGGVIELVAVIDPTRPFAATVAQTLSGRGQGMHALVLASDDPAGAALALAATDVADPGDLDNEIVAFGTRFVIEDV